MIRWAIYGMVYLGALLMVHNIYCYNKYAHATEKRGDWGKDKSILFIPVILLVLFLIGYLFIGIFGNPDIVMAAVLFGGSIFVFIMYKLVSRITDKVIENEKLEAELMAAEQSSKAKSSFLASISHEMRTPMNVILGLDGLALNNPDLPEETRQQLEKINQSGRHLLGLINNTLDMNSIETGELCLKQENFSLGESIEQINAIIKTLCDEKGLRFDVSVAEDADNYYIGDEMLLKQTLLNILENAVKYTEKGSISFDIKKEETDKDNCKLMFTIAVTGIGMSEEFLQRAFQVFSQEDSSSTNRYGGSGLGLAVAKSMTDLMGGEIKVNSKKDEGSTFVITIPFKYGEEKKENAVTDETVDLDGLRILIVEDIDENAEIVSDLLELENVECERAQNGKVALEMFEKSDINYYDAILMDLRMPMMDGLEASRKIRELDRNDAEIIPIIALTANAFESDIEQSLKAGMNAHLVKPVDADLLYTTIKQLVYNAREKGGLE